MPRLFAVVLLFALAAFSAPAAQDVWTGVDRIVAIGDVHGDYDQFVTLLKQTGLVNQKMRWSGGKTHLVQVGDVPDRGPGTRKIMDLMMRLEKQARKAKGYVHALIGNHEAMNVYGDLRYVTKAEFNAFKTSDSSRVRDIFYERHAKEVKDKTGKAPDDAAKKKWYAEHPLGYFEQRVAFGPKGKYGKWIRSHNAVIKINDSLFLHGGISPRLEDWKIRDINNEIRKELKDFSLLKGGLALAEDGPLWYRGLAQGNQRDLLPNVEAALANYGVKRIVIGHTPTAGTVMPRFGGRVLVIDVGLSKYYGSRLACLVIENDEPYTLHRGKRLNLPDGSREGVLAYLKAAAALDPQPSPLAPVIAQLEAAPAATR